MLKAPGSSSALDIYFFFDDLSLCPVVCVIIQIYIEIIKLCLNWENYIYIGISKTSNHS